MRRSQNSRICFIVFIVLSGLWSGSLYASPDVYPQDRIKGSPLTVQEGLEMLGGFGCIPSLFTGDAIHSQDEISRLVAEAVPCGERDDSPLLRQTLRQLGNQYPRQEDVPWNQIRFSRPTAHLQYLGFGEDQRALVRPDRVDAMTSPWRSYREGIEYNHGSNGLMDARLGGSVGRWFDVTLQPQLLSNRDDSAAVSLHSGTTKMTFSNFEAKAGRSPVIWGQGHEGNVIYSDNVRPFDLIQIGNPHPLQLPGILRYLGPFQYRFFVTRLNQQGAVDDPFHISFRVMAKPTDNWELGLTRGLIFAGGGSPGFSWWEVPAEIVGIRIKEGYLFNIPIKPRGTGGELGNNVTSLDARLRLPAVLRGTEVFLEVYEEDPLDFQDFFPQDTIFHGGVWIPRLSVDGAWQLLVDGTHTADFVYTHTVFRSGLTQSQRLIGNDIGFSGNEFRIGVGRIFLPHLKLWESTGMKLYTIPNQSGPTEMRILVQSGTTFTLTQEWQASVQGGLQRVRNFNFIDGADRTTFLADVNLHYLW